MWSSFTFCVTKLQDFFHLAKLKLYWFKKMPPFFFPSSCQSPLYFLSLWIWPLNSCKWNHIAFVISCHTSFTYHNPLGHLHCSLCYIPYKFFLFLILAVLSLCCSWQASFSCTLRLALGHVGSLFPDWGLNPYSERLLLNEKMPGFLASGGEEFNLGPETKLDHSELLCNKVLLKYKGDRESFWHRHQKGAERVPPC